MTMNLPLDQLARRLIPFIAGNMPGQPKFFRGARVFNNADITLTTAVTTILTFNSERYDTDNFHSTSANTSRMTIPYAGVYRIGACVRFAAHVVGYRQLYLQVNAGSIIADIVLNTNSVGGISTDLVITTDWQFIAGDYVEFGVTQTSGGNLNVASIASWSPEFWIAQL